MTQAQATNREPTMEEILASIRRIIEDNNAPKVDELAAVATSESDVADFEREFAAADVFSKPVQSTIVAQESAKQENAKQDFAKEVASAAQDYVEPAIDLPGTYEQEVAYQTPVVEMAEARVPAFQELRPIISESASRQVAKSFEHLSVALSEERNTSVAQMTEDMVRPMLQDWLDNNLPTLVERLVREEIERVSRGTR
jgi:cell pole-organizing protein PopZ